MENSLKQRIIGAVVLAALAIIFLPAILKEKVSNGPFVSQIPEQPQALKDYVIDKKKIDDLVSDKDKIKDQLNKQLADSRQAGLSSESADNGLKNEALNGSGANKRKSKAEPTQATGSPTSANKDARESTPQVKQIEPPKTFIASAWVVQVASFAKESNAISLVRKLKDSQFKAYRRKVKANNQQVYRVFVGPYIEKKDAASASEKIAKVSETAVVVRPFDPVSS